jgi:hypothetical protein
VNIEKLAIIYKLTVEEFLEAQRKYLKFLYQGKTDPTDEQVLNFIEREYGDTDLLENDLFYEDQSEEELKKELEHLKTITAPDFNEEAFDVWWKLEGVDITINKLRNM